MTHVLPIRRRKLADEVQDRLLEIIRSGDLEAGDLLPSERELMAAYSVGRPAIREAMQNLQRMGLVEIRHGGRPRVAQPSIANMMEQMAEPMRHLLTRSETSLNYLKEARATFEMEMARIAASKRTEADIATLRSLLDRHAAARKEPKLFLELDGEFHRAVAGISGNPIFEALSGSLFTWLAHFHLDLVSRPGLEKLTLEEHEAIFAAIKQGDPALAAKNMSDHLNRANRLYHTTNPRKAG
ncbi:transcriptional regulator NanR [Chelativorans sp.]|uniref:transcriptional regulator NanR n=1 Tax=Chelativorans sp. TaxID=2203393 RepID=UPI002811DCE2|nr:transcriptional regulator NanR [Chelativorans sp.]